MALTDKQRRFVDEYLLDLNATQAAIRAEYGFAEGVHDGYYTYLLIDPRNAAIFYVGKGKGDRVSSHARLVRAGKVDNAEKCRRIREIHEAALEVTALVFSQHDAETGAFDVERWLIASLRDSGITNIAGGVVTNERAGQERAAAMLSRMMTYDEWIATASAKRLEWAAIPTGSARATYDHIRAELTRLAGEGRPLDALV